MLESQTDSERRTAARLPAAQYKCAVPLTNVTFGPFFVRRRRGLLKRIVIGYRAVLSATCLRTPAPYWEASLEPGIESSSIDAGLTSRDDLQHSSAER